MSKALIAALVERRGVLKKELDGLLEVPTQEKRNLTDDESANFDRIEKEIRDIDARVTQLDEQVKRDEAAGEVAKRVGVGGAKVTREPDVYRKGPYGRSFVRDLFNARQKGDRDAYERLERNNRMRSDAMEKMAAEKGYDLPEKRAISTTNGAGGEFVPPLWLEEEFVRFVRPGRITANLCRQSEVPPGTDSINIPKVLTGTATAPQASQNTGVQQTDLTTSSVSSPVVTIAGGQTVSLQLIEQSPLNIDEIVLQDLAADYAKQLNTQVINGAGTGGTLTGILTLAGTNSVAWTQTTPSIGGAGGMYPSVANGIQKIHTTRYLPPNVIVMHPRRWAWALAQSDGNGRPLVVPAAGSPYNAMGNQEQNASQGFAGSMQMLPVYLDALIPTNLGAGTNQDEIIVLKADDLWLWEGQVRAEAFQQTYAQNMSVFVRLYNYASFQAGRYPVSICGITGTGAVTPTF